MAIYSITVPDLTGANVEGTGVFDVLMKAAKGHLEQEFNLSRIRGPEYSQVYLGMMDQVLGQSVQFLLSKDKAANEARMVDAQVLLINAQIDAQVKQNALIDQQILKMIQDVLLTKAQVSKLGKDELLVDQQILNAQQEVLLSAAQVLKMNFDANLSEQQVLNLQAEALNIPKQGAKIDADVLLSTAQKGLITQQALNAVTEETVLVAQECKLRAEYDVLMETKLKTATEKELLLQKVATERAQVTAIGVDVDSVVGRQKDLYKAQTDGFARDAEQKAAEVLVGSWKIRRSTDEGTVADATNKLNDATIGSAVTKLLSGVGL